MPLLFVLRAMQIGADAGSLWFVLDTLCRLAEGPSVVLRSCHHLDPWDAV